MGILVVNDRNLQVWPLKLLVPPLVLKFQPQSRDLNLNFDVETTSRHGDDVRHSQCIDLGLAFSFCFTENDAHVSKLRTLHIPMGQND